MSTFGGKISTQKGRRVIIASAGTQLVILIEVTGHLM